MPDIRLHRAESGSWTAKELPESLPDLPSLGTAFAAIEARAVDTASAGALPLWEGYQELENYPGDVTATAKRSSNQVRTKRRTGEFYTWLVTSFGPREIVEIGSAFGVSGMYWCAGLAANGAGNFTGFEPNDAWSPYASQNVRSVWDRARIVRGTFEENLKDAPDRIDLAFIDAIHTPEFVDAQLTLVLERAAQGALVVLDDIRFSPAMKDYWTTVRDNTRFAAAFEVTRRVGVLELAS